MFEKWHEKKFCWAAFLYIALIFLVNHPLCYGRSLIEDRESMPGPTLLYPGTQDIDLKSQAFLEFRWERTDRVTTDHYEFRLYKGYQTVEDTLLLKKQLSTDEFPFKLDASTFEVNQVYTWSLTQVYSDGRKSDKSFASFKIIKK
jgi:hypothetical protein